MKLPREIGWLRRKCTTLSEITNVMHIFLFDGYTITLMALDKPSKFVCTGTFENFREFQYSVWKYYNSVYKQNVNSNFNNFSFMSNYKRKM